MKKDHKVYASGIFWICLGIILFLGTKWFDLDKKNLIDIVKETGIQFGISLICLGIVAIIIQLKDWKLYFQERLKDIVIQQSYLNTLNDDELSSLQIAILKAKFKETDIEREGSFLHYFQKKIQHYIGSYYREHVTCSLLIKEDETNEDLFKVYDDVTYTCRSIGHEIQKDVKWLYEPGEFENIENMTITFFCPIISTDCSVNCEKKSKCIDRRIRLDKKILDEKFPSINENAKGYIVKINEVAHSIDQLQIEISSSYTIRKEHFLTWSMTHPSKDISFTIAYPDNYTIKHFMGGVEPQEYSKNINGNMFTFKHEGWLLPRAGLAYKLFKI